MTSLIILMQLELVQGNFAVIEKIVLGILNEKKTSSGLKGCLLTIIHLSLQCAATGEYLVHFLKCLVLLLTQVYASENAVEILCSMLQFVQYGKESMIVASLWGNQICNTNFHFYPQ